MLSASTFHMAVVTAQPVLGFIAHDVAGWIGVPTAIVIVGLVMLRKWGRQRMASRKRPTA